MTLNFLIVRFFQHSIGEIKLESGRTSISGDLMIEKSLISQNIESFNGSLMFLSDGALRMEANPSAIIMDNEFLVQTNSLKIQNSLEETILHISPKYVETRFGFVKLHGKAKAVKSLQAQQIVSANNMKISSPTKNLQMSSNKDMFLKTAIGDLHVNALKNLDFEAQKVSFSTSWKLRFRL